MRRPPPPTPLTRAAFARLRAETTPDRTLFEVRAAINASGLDWEGDQLMIDLLFSNPEQAEELYEEVYAPLLAIGTIAPAEAEAER